MQLPYPYSLFTLTRNLVVPHLTDSEAAVLWKSYTRRILRKGAVGNVLLSLAAADSSNGDGTTNDQSSDDSTLNNCSTSPQEAPPSTIITGQGYLRGVDKLIVEEELEMIEKYLFFDEKDPAMKRKRQLQSELSKLKASLRKDQKQAVVNNRITMGSRDGSFTSIGSSAVADLGIDPNAGTAGVMDIDELVGKRPSRSWEVAEALKDRILIISSFERPNSQYSDLESDLYNSSGDDEYRIDYVEDDDVSLSDVDDASTLASLRFRDEERMENPFSDPRVDTDVDAFTSHCEDFQYFPGCDTFSDVRPDTAEMPKKSERSSPRIPVGDIAAERSMVSDGATSSSSDEVISSSSYVSSFGSKDEFQFPFDSILGGIDVDQIYYAEDLMNQKQVRMSSMPYAQT